MYGEMRFHTPCASDLLVSALVDSEDLTPIIKAVYRSGSTAPLHYFRLFVYFMSLRRGLEKKFVIKLEEFQTKKAAEISDLCYSGYKSFVISVCIEDYMICICFGHQSTCHAG